jgi:hypothetical protein
MAGSDDQIDALYQLTLDEFTNARNALAKETGDNSIKKLEKPNAAAWAVNQLYWHERKLYDEVIKTAGQVRAAYQQMLAGKTADVRAAETFRNETLRKAKQAIRGVLEKAGNKAADAVMTAVTETLDALPSEEPPGRLTKPLRRTGFEALQGLPIAAKGKAAPLKPETGKKAPEKDLSEKEKRAREARQQELAMAKERLRFAESAEREAEAALERAKRAVERAEKTRERIEGELQEAAAAEKAARKEQAASASAYEKAKAISSKLRGSISASSRPS